MSNTWYIVITIAVSGAVTLLLRALPFAVLKKLRKSRFVTKLGEWMPVGLMLILAVITTQGELVSRPNTWWITATSLAATVAVHYLTKRKTVWSVLVGTASYVSLLALFG